MAKLLSRLTRSAHAAFGLVAALAALALWGWAVDVPLLRDLGADFAPMSAPAALAFLLLAEASSPRSEAAALRRTSLPRSPRRWR